MSSQYKFWEGRSVARRLDLSSFNENLSAFQYNPSPKTVAQWVQTESTSSFGYTVTMKKVLIPKNLSYPMSIKNLEIFLDGGRTKKKINCKNSYLANYCFPRYFCYRLDNYRWLENGRFHCWHWSANKNVFLLFSWKNLEQD